MVEEGTGREIQLNKTAAIERGRRVWERVRRRRKRRRMRRMRRRKRRKRRRRRKKLQLIDN